MGIIRLMLALSVVVWHMPGPHVRLLNAAVAVLCFFVVSGFYMALVVNERYGPSGEGWVGRFYSARFLRLYPAYAAMCIVMIGWYWLTGNPNAFTSRLPIPAGEQALIAAINVGVIGQDLYELMNHIDAPWVRSLFGAGFFNPGFMLVGQAWSLSSEIFFYLLVPFVVRSPLRLVAVLAASLAIRWIIVGHLGWQSGVWGYWFIPATMCLFTLGSFSYYVYRAVKRWKFSAVIGWGALVLMGAWFVWEVAAHGIILPVDGSNNLDQPRFWFAYLAFAVAVPFVFIATKNVHADRAIGDLSYPLYLCHGLIVGVAFNRYGLPQDAVTSIVIATAASIAGAIALRWIEVLVERWLTRERPVLILN